MAFTAVVKTGRLGKKKLKTSAKAAVLAAWDESVRPITNWFGVRAVFAGLFAVPAGFLVTIVVSLFTRAPSENVRRLVDNLRTRAA